MIPYAAFLGWGLAVPDRVVTNADLEQLVDTSDEWITTRTGIRERRIVSPGEYTSTLATRAAERALASARIAIGDVDMIILATCTPDRPFPATACTVQANLGARSIPAFDLVAACSGFVYGLQVATSLIRGGAARTILFISADVFSHYLDWTDRNTCVLFGDGAGAVVLRGCGEPLGMLSCDLGAAGELEDLLAVEAGGTRLPITPVLLEARRQYVVMNGREVFKHATRGMVDSSLRALEAAQLTLADIDLVIPHQANMRIIEATAKRLDIDMDRVVVNLDRYGNTSAGTIPIALAEAADAGRLAHGDHVLFTAFGGGLTWGSAVARWGRPT